MTKLKLRLVGMMMQILLMGMTYHLHCNGHGIGKFKMFNFPKEQINFINKRQCTLVYLAVPGFSVVNYLTEFAIMNRGRALWCGRKLDDVLTTTSEFGQSMVS